LIGEGIVPSPFIERLATRVPVVIFAGTPHEQAVDVVAADNLSGSAAVVTHLIRDHGKRRLFWVHGPADSPDSRERRYGLDYVLRASPQCELTGFYEGYYSVESGEKAGESLLAMPRRELPDAVVSANDQMAIGVVKALTRAGVRVPEDVAVVGFDDIFPGSLCDPPLTTVHQPMRMLGERACARLLDRIASPALRPATELLHTELVLRSSCGCPPGTVVRQSVPTLKVVRSELSAATPLLPSPQPGRRPARQAAKA
jgi:LacI family transcriptional regulator